MIQELAGLLLVLIALGGLAALKTISKGPTDSRCIIQRKLQSHPLALAQVVDAYADL